MASPFLKITVLGAFTETITLAFSKHLYFETHFQKYAFLLPKTLLLRKRTGKSHKKFPFFGWKRCRVNSPSIILIRLLQLMWIAVFVLWINMHHWIIHSKFGKISVLMFKHMPQLPVYFALYVQKNSQSWSLLWIGYKLVPLLQQLNHESHSMLRAKHINMKASDNGISITVCIESIECW